MYCHIGFDREETIHFKKCEGLGKCVLPVLKSVEKVVIIWDQ